MIRTKFAIVPDMTSSVLVTMNPADARLLGADRLKKTMLRFGQGCAEVQLALCPEAARGELVLAHAVIDRLKLPLVPHYELRVSGGQLLLGPYIGILAARTQEKLSKTVASLSNYLYNYDRLGGAVIAFALEGVSPDRQSISGYLYHPESGRWTEGIFPYPAAVFQRINAGRHWRVHFQSVLGNRVFNSYVFNKWEMYRWLSGVPGIKEHLPETELYRNGKGLLRFLAIHGKAYLKPVWGSQGSGIIEAVRYGNTSMLRFAAGGQLRELCCDSAGELTAALKAVTVPGRYLVQQGVELLRLEQRIVDFRLILVKDSAGIWRDMGFVGRCSQPLGIVSNVSSGGQAEPGEKMLAAALPAEPAEAIYYHNRMAAVAVAAASAVEQTGVHLGNLGIDLAIDTKGHIWLIEINNRDPNHTIALDAGDRQLFYQIKEANMLYAKHLAGFGEE